MAVSTKIHQEEEKSAAVMDQKAEEEAAAEKEKEDEEARVAKRIEEMKIKQEEARAAAEAAEEEAKHTFGFEKIDIQKVRDADSRGPVAAPRPHAALSSHAARACATAVVRSASCRSSGC